VELGNSAALSFTLSNDGGVEASFALSEFEGSFQPVSGSISQEKNLPASPASPPEGQDVLIACADFNYGEGKACQPFASILRKFTDIRSVDVFDASAGTPTLDELLHYDVVITWQNDNYADSVQMGNVLADYVDAGGKVINSWWAFPGILEGRFSDENYTAMNGNDWVITMAPILLWPVSPSCASGSM
jgi:hypothetical protein